MIKNKKYYLLLLILIIVIIILLTGCWDFQDVNKRSIVISVGVDRVNDQIQFSGEIARLVSQTTDQQNQFKTPNVYNDISYGKNFEEARMDFNSHRPYPTFLGSIRVVVFGKKFAQNNIEPYINRLNKLYDYRKTVLAVVSRENPGEIFELDIKKDIAAGFLIDNTIRNLANQGMTVYTTIGEILSHIALGEVGYVLPYIGIEEESIKYLGFAIIKENKLERIIKTENSKGILYLKADNLILNEDLKGVKDKNNTYSFRVLLADRNINTEYVKNQIYINIDLNIKAQLQYQYIMEEYSDKNIEKMEVLLTEKIKSYLEDVIKKTKEESECDIFNFALYFRADNPNIYKEINWSKKYPDSIINYNVKVNINNENMSDPIEKNTKG